jgi:hypothetical protein
VCPSPLGIFVGSIVAGSTMAIDPVAGLDVAEAVAALAGVDAVPPPPPPPQAVRAMVNANKGASAFIFTASSN